MTKALAISLLIGAFTGALLALNLAVIASPVAVKPPQQIATGYWVDFGRDRGACVCPDWDGCVCMRFDVE
jgi:hypothetical protein